MKKDSNKSAAQKQSSGVLTVETYCAGQESACDITVHCTKNIQKVLIFGSSIASILKEYLQVIQKILRKGTT